MSGTDGWDFGPEENQNPEDIERALERVTATGKRRVVIRRGAGVGSAITVAVLIIGGLIYGGKAVVSPSTEPAGSSHATTTLAPTTTAAPKPSDGRPKLVVGSLFDPNPTAKTQAPPGLAVLDPQTGSVVRVLDANAAPSSIQLSPDGSTVYYDTDEPALGTGCMSIYKVAVSGGKPVLLDQNVGDPVLSSDGKRLAFVTSCGTYAPDVSDRNTVFQAIEVMDLASRKTHSIAEIRAATDLSFANLMWTSDGKYVAAATVGVNPQSQNTFLYDASVSHPVNMYGDTSSKPFNPPGFAGKEGSQEPEWVTEEQLTDGSILAITECCNFNTISGPMSVVVVKNGQVAKTIATMQAHGSAGPIIDNVVADARGQYFAYTVSNAGASKDGLWVLDKVEATPVRLADNVNLVAWR